MKRTITIVFLSFVLTVLVLMTAWAGYQAVTIRKDNLRRIGNKVSLFNDNFSGTALSEKGTATPELRKKAVDLFGDEGRLQALIVYSKRDGIIFKSSLSDDRKINAQVNALPDRLLPPTFKLNGFFHFSRTGEVSDRDNNKIYILYIFESLGKSDIVYILTICLFVVIGLSLLTLLMIIITSRMGNDRPVQAADSSQGLYSAPAKAKPIKREIRRAPDPEEEFGDIDLPEGGSIEDDLSGLNLDDGGDFSAPDEDFSLPDSFDALDDQTEANDQSLKKKIPDIPEEEDLRAVEHERKDPSSVELEEDLELPDIEDSADNSFSLDDLSSDELEDIDLDTGDLSLTEIGDDPETKSLYSPKSGFCWESFLPERLKHELDRAAADNEDLLLLLFKDEEAQVDTGTGQLASLLKEQYPHNDLNFEYTGSGFAVIIQNTEMEAGIAELEDLLKRWNEMNSIKTIRVGLSARCGRLVESDRLIKEAESALSKASDENPIVGFRPDPEKFRQFITKNG